MLSKSFKPAKCKTSLKLAVARIKLLRNKREVQVKQMRRELAQLLESGQEQTARIRALIEIKAEWTCTCTCTCRMPTVAVVCQYDKSLANGCPKCVHNGLLL